MFKPEAQHRLAVRSRMGLTFLVPRFERSVRPPYPLIALVLMWSSLDYTAAAIQAAFVSFLDRAGLRSSRSLQRQPPLVEAAGAVP